MNDTHTKKAIFFFDLFGMISLRNFLIQNDEKIVNKYSMESRKNKNTNKKLSLMDNKIRNIKKIFFRSACKALEDKEISQSVW